FFFYVLEARTSQGLSQATVFAEAKHVSASRRQERSANVFVHNGHRAGPIRLIKWSPRQKAGAARRLENAMRFTQCSIAFGEEHHSEATGGKIKGVIEKGKILG